MIGRCHVDASGRPSSGLWQRFFRFRQVRGCLRKATGGDVEKDEGVACHEEKKATKEGGGKFGRDQIDYARDGEEWIWHALSKLVRHTAGPKAAGSY